MTPTSAFRAARLIDGLSGLPSLNPLVRVEGGRLSAILPETADPQALDLGSLTLLPGFIDVHLHLVGDPAGPVLFDPREDRAVSLLRAAGNAQAALRAGLTTVCDLGAPNHLIFPLRDAIRRGALRGPRILASGAALTPPGGHGDFIGRVVSGVEAVRRAVRTQVRAGADLIKVMATGGGGEDPGQSLYSLEELRAIAAEARRCNVRVAAHCHGTEGIRNSLAAGIHRLEHCTFLSRAGSTFEPELAHDLVRGGLVICPTNVIDYRRMQAQGGSERGLAPRTELNRTWRQLYASGVPFAAGSDAGVPGMFYDDYALIPELMVTELGLSPMQAIQACTRVAAQALGLEAEIGTLQVGKLADVVAVDGNPLEDITALRRVRWVMRGGQVLWP